MKERHLSTDVQYDAQKSHQSINTINTIEVSLNPTVNSISSIHEYY